MQDNNYSKRRYYLNKKGPNYSYTSPYNNEKNKYKNLKLSEKVNYNQRYLGLRSNDSNESENINSKNKKEQKDIVKDNISFNNKLNNYIQCSKDVSNYKSNDNNNNNKSLNYYKSPTRYNYLNKTNNNDNKNNRYYNYMNKKPDYKTVINNNESKDNLSNNNNNGPKSKNKKIIINNYDYNKIFTNQTYDNNFEKSKNKNNEKEKIPVIVVEKNRRYRFTTHNNYNERKKIIRIQAVWRGYFLRKIAVGSIKKYIGFIALFKYLDSIINSNKHKIFREIINLFKKHSNKNTENLKFKYKNLNVVSNEDKNNKEKNKQNNCNDKSNNTNSNKRYRNFNFLKSKKNNNTDKGLFKNNYIFNNVKFEPLSSSYNSNNLNNNNNNNNNNNKKGVTIFFINREKEKEKEREKEERKKEQIEREKENEKRKLEREQRRKEQIEREKENENRRLEKLRKEKELKEKREKDLKEKLEKLRLENEKKEKERKEKEKKERRERIRREEKEKMNNVNNNDEDIFSKPIKIIYVPKKINMKNNYKYYQKRITRDKRNKMERLVKFLYKKCYKENYPLLLYQLKIIRKLNIAKIKLDSLYNIINKMQKKKLKNWLKIYRENVLNEKVREEIMKKNIFQIYKDKYNEELLENINIKYTKIPNKFMEKEISDIIIEDKNENEEDINNTIEEKIILRGNRKYLPKDNNKQILLRNILNKKINLENKNKYNILNNYFKKWNKRTNKYFEKEKPNIKLNLHSPDMEIRGKSKKKHIKIKFTRAITSKTSLGSIKSEDKSNSSIIHTKKMRIKNIVVNQTEYLTTTLLNNSQIYQNSINKNKKIIKLLYLIDKIDNKNSMYKVFKYWKKYV